MCKEKAWQDANMSVIYDDAGRALGGGKLYIKGLQGLDHALRAERVQKLHAKKQGVSA